MTEWVLIISMFLTSEPPGEIRDIAPQVIDGFHSKDKCEAAATLVAQSLIVLSGAAREQQGIPGHTSKSSASIHHECISIIK